MVLERYLPDIKSEIAHTDSKEFREALKDREVFMTDLIGRLKHWTLFFEDITVAAQTPNMPPGIGIFYPPIPIVGFGGGCGFLKKHDF